MAQDPSDNKTQDLVGGEDQMHRVNAVVEQASEDAHLAAEHKLVPVRAYIKDEAKAEKITANNARQKRFLEKQKESGLVKSFIPETVAEEVKNTEGGFNTWLNAKLAQAAAAVPAPVEIEKVVNIEVPAKLTVDQEKAIKLGTKVMRLTGWRRSMVSYLIGGL